MFNLFLVLLLGSLVALAAGLISPSKVLKWNNATQTRKQVVKIFGSAAIILLIAMGVTAPEIEQETTQAPIKDEQSIQETKNAPPISYDLIDEQDLSYAGCKRIQYKIIVPNDSTEDQISTALMDLYNKKTKLSDKIFIDAYLESQRKNYQNEVYYGRLNMDPNCDNSNDYKIDFDLKETIESEDKSSYLEQAPTQELSSVSRVIDGDTVVLNINGKDETIRLIGINTPETKDPRKPVECFGYEASSKAKELLENKKVTLTPDSTQDTRDKYGRLLGYIHTEDGLFFNLEMIKQGYAYEYTYNTPYKYQEDFKQAQNEAQQAKRGLWASDTCNGELTLKANETETTSTINTPTEQTATPTTTSPTTEVNTSPAVTPEPITSPTTDCNIKGNISSSGEKIYHYPGCASYSRTKIDESEGERWFCTKEEAVGAGWREARNCN